MKHLSKSLSCLPMMCLAGFVALPVSLAVANDTDEQGRLIAAPAEADLVERGYLFYPLRVLPKNQAATSGPAALVRTADGVVAPLPVQTSPLPDNAPLPAAKATPAAPPADHAPDHTDHGPKGTHASTDHATSQATQPAAASSSLKRIEPIKPLAFTPPKSGSDHDAGHAQEGASGHAKPALSKAELAKAERAKAAQERAEKLKEEQAKAALAREEKLKEQKAKAEQLKAERAKAAQERAEKLKEEQAKAALARAERVRAAALAKVDRALEELARADKMKDDLVKAELAKAQAAKDEAPAEDTTKDAAKDTAKDENAKAEAVKEEPPKPTQSADHPATVAHEAPPAKAKPAPHADHGDKAPADSHAAASSAAHDQVDASHAPAPVPAPMTAGKKILVINAQKEPPPPSDH